LGESKSMTTKHRIGLVTAFPLYAGAEPAVEPQFKLIHILEPLSEEITWVAANCAAVKPRLPSKATILNIHSPYYLRQRNGEDHFLTRLFFFLLHQMKIVFALFKLRKKLDMLVFACGADLYVFPILLGKLLRKTIILRSAGRPSGVFEKYYRKPSKHKKALYKIVEKASYLLADRLLPESEYMVDLYNLHRYQNKIADGSLYVDASFLRRSKKLAERTYRTGYIGRFSSEKGVLEFAQSLLFLLKEDQAQAIMIGDGDEKDDIEQILMRGNIQDKVRLIGWTQQGEIPNYLSDIKIVVVPSYREGLPNIVLEAMGCGCIVVATPVGGIPGVIKDGETGFIMENNSPDCIARNVVRALNHPNLEEIGRNAHALIERKFTYRTAVERYGSVIASLPYPKGIEE
jgi:glycosyltransferase involved in cell wall biosynthesis